MNVLRNILVLAAMLAPSAALDAADGPKIPTTPNIVFILADDKY